MYNTVFVIYQEGAEYKVPLRYVFIWHDMREIYFFNILM